MVFIDLSPLKFRNFRFLYLSQLISLLGSQMTMVTIPFQLYSLTQSTFQTGLVSAIELICLVCTALWGGVLADKLDRRTIIVRAEALMMLLTLVLAFNALSGSPQIWLIYLLAGCISALNGFHRPAFEALTPLTVTKSVLPKVSSLLSFKYVCASLLGPTVAGFLVASTGPVATYMIDASSFALSLFLLMRITIAKESEDKQESSSESLVAQVIDGAQYIYKRKDVLASYLMDFFAMVFCMPQVLFPALAQFHGKTSWLGILYVSIGFGGLFATLISRWTSSVKRLGVGITFAASGWALSILFVGVTNSFWLMFVGFFCAGVCDSYSGIFRSTMWNESIPDKYRGRIASFSMLSYTSGPLLGNSIIGFLGDSLGLHRSLAVGGSISVIAIIVTTMCLPNFLQYRSPNN